MIISFFPWPKCHIYGDIVFAVFLFFLWVHLFVFILFCFLFFELTELLCIWASTGQAEQNSEIVLLYF